MFDRLISRLRFRAAARKYARLLGPKLSHDYGSSADYTPAQIEAAAKKLRLPIRYLCLGQAAFLAEEQFAKIAAGNDLGSYAELRTLFDLYKPARPISTEFGEAPENTYAGGGGGQDLR